MLYWRLTTTSLSGCTLHMARRRMFRISPLAAAIGALVATLALGRIGPSISIWSDTPAMGVALAVIAGIGILCWYIAKLTVLPLADSRSAALIAALMALLLPGAGIGGLALPVGLSLWLAWRNPSQRVIALMVHCSALTAVTGAAQAGSAGGFAYATTIGLAAILTLRDLPGAANDNPSMERSVPRWRLPANAVHARCESIPGMWGVSNV